MDNERIIKAINTTLSALHERSYYQKADDGTETPFITFELQITSEEQMYTGRLEINLWDNSEIPDDLESLAKTINGNGIRPNPSGLDCKVVQTQDNILFFVHETNIDLINENENLKNKQLIYQIRIY